MGEFLSERHSSRVAAVDETHDRKAHEPRGHWTILLLECISQQDDFGKKAL